MSKAATIPGARATLLLSLTMSFIGVTGAVNAFSLVTASAGDLEAASAGQEERDPLGDFAIAAIRSPVMKGAQVANLLASSLLIIASVLLTGRRRSSLWWTRQALIANLLYTFGNAVATMWFAAEHPGLLETLFESQEGLEGSRMLAFGIGTSCGALLIVGLYAILLRVSMRGDVRSFVCREPA